jgi:hypothetical protein
MATRPGGAFTKEPTSSATDANETYVSEISDSLEGHVENSVLSREDTIKRGRHEVTDELDIR